MTKPDKNAKAKATEYKADINGETPAEEAKPTAQPPRSMESWNDLVGQRIEEAMRQGAFDNLRGHGKPLDLQRNPFVPEDQEMAFNILANNDATPSWIGERTSTLKAIEQWRDGLHKLVGYYQAESQKTTTEPKRQQLQTRWTAQLQRWTTEIINLNKRIELVNLAQPIAHLEIYKLLLDEELKRVGMTRVIE
jgi:hypothetical protein